MIGGAAGERAAACDLLAVSGGWNPAVQLFSQSQGRLRFDETLQAFVPHLSAQAERSAGACRGVYGTAAAVADGFAAGSQAAELAGVREREVFRVPECDEPAQSPPAALWTVPARRPSPDRPAGAAGTAPAAPDPSDSTAEAAHGPGAGGDAEAFVDLQRDVTVADLGRAAGAGLRSVEHVKRYTTAGTGAEQGKTSGATAVGVVAALLGVEPGQVGTTTFRPPYTPVAFGVLAGRDRGALSDPIRVTAMHDLHVARGAVFEDVGQWKRPATSRWTASPWRRRSSGSAGPRGPGWRRSTPPPSGRSRS
nr:hypothetical protein GCM10020093_104840 [Planobispora longispora]